jgi:hypothetical protein
MIVVIPGTLISALPQRLYFNGLAEGAMKL